MEDKKKYTKKEAQEKLYLMWEDGEVPANFTEDHSEYSVAINHLMKFGRIDWDDICL